MTRVDEASLRLAVTSLCATLILGQFPAPLSQLLVTSLGYLTIVVGPRDALALRYLNHQWLLAKVRGLKPREQGNAMFAGLVMGGSSVLPLGWLWSSVLAGGVGYLAVELGSL
jgi:hypothetical protein